jgi:hypothetical protein
MDVMKMVNRVEHKYSTRLKSQSEKVVDEFVNDVRAETNENTSNENPCFVRSRCACGGGSNFTTIVSRVG